MKHRITLFLQAILRRLLFGSAGAYGWCHECGCRHIFKDNSGRIIVDCEQWAKYVVKDLK